MAKQRDLVKMSDDEVWAYIATQRDMHTATIGKDGMPHLTTNYFGIDGRTLVFNTYGSSQKAVNLIRDPRASVLFADGENYRALKGVNVQGRVEIITDPQEREAARQTISRHRLPASDTRPAAANAGKALDEGRRVIFRIIPTKIISWDHSKLPPPQAA